MGITYNVILSSDLRDSGGNQLKIVEVTGVEGTYPSGGVIMNPADFGFTNILAVSAQSKVIAPTNLEDEATWTQPWEPLADINPVRTDLNLDGNYEWRLIILLHPAGFGGEAGDGMFEVPDGTPMIFYPQSAPTLMVVGS